MDQGKSHKNDPIFWLRQDYIFALEQAGAIPLPLPSTQEGKILKHYFNIISGLMITGGDFDINPIHYGERNQGKVREVQEDRTSFEKNMVLLAKKQNLPTLGICGGAQLMNIAFGGTLVQHLDGHEGIYHPLKIQPSSFLQKLFQLKKNQNNVLVNSRHHQAIKKVAKDFKVSAYSEDNVIEAIEYKDSKKLFFVGVQWHPESMIKDHEEQRNLLLQFVKAAKSFHQNKTISP